MSRLSCLALTVVWSSVLLQITPSTLAQPDLDTGAAVARHHSNPSELNVDDVNRTNSGDGGFGGFGDGNGNVNDRQDVSSCQLTEDGFFGDSGTPEVVDYYYELTLIPTFDLTTTNQQVLPALERGFTNALIPDLFPEANCDDEEEDTAEKENDQRRRLSRRLSSRTTTSRRTKVVGISMRAEDRVLDGVACSTPSDTCVVVAGEFRLFTDMYEAQTKLLGLDNPSPEVILEALVLKAKEGAFDNLHPAVEKITILSKPPPSVVNNGEGLEDDPDNGGNLKGGQDGNNNLALGLSLAVVAALLVAAAAVTYRRRQRNNDQDDTDTYQHVEEINSLAPPPSSVV
mmetsp:Transcript_22555/g.34781  ORF Transcript_22555/g.34781 Transcript_22555/m.34781 type:complete len:343 (+) Transcript_22555:597-1625(+)